MAAGALVLLGLGLTACSKEVAANDLEAGDCTDDELAGTTADVDTVDCDESHRFEVFATVELDDADDAEHPGADALDTTAAEECNGERFEEYVGVPFVESEIHTTYLVPTQDSWESAADRTIICFAYEPEDPTATELVPTAVEGSVEGAGR